MSRGGFTLTELLVGSFVSTIMVGALTYVYMQETHFQGEIQRRSAFGMSQLLPAAAVTHLSRQLETADRVVIPAGRTDTVVYRTLDYLNNPACNVLVPADSAPPASCLDDAANYRWDQYWWDSAAKQWVWFRDIRSPAGAKQCASRHVLVNDITLGQLAFVDSGVSSLGAEPFGDARDNNLLAYTLQWDGQVETAGKQTILQQRLFAGQVALRHEAYTRVNSVNDAARLDSGSGLAVPGLSEPPDDGSGNLAVCP